MIIFTPGMILTADALNSNFGTKLDRVNNLNSILTIGSNAGANTPSINFASSGNAVAFDSQIIASGGTTSSGQGKLTYTASGGHNFVGSIVVNNISFPNQNGVETNFLRSTPDNAIRIGTPAYPYGDETLIVGPYVDSGNTSSAYGLRVGKGNIVTINEDAYGYYDSAVAASFMQGGGDHRTGFNGGFQTGVPAIAGYGGIDKGAFYASSFDAPPKIILTGMTIGATRITLATPLTAGQLAYLRKNMFLQTNNASNFGGWTSFITGWDTISGNWIDTCGWAQSGGGNSSPNQVPSGALPTGQPQTIYVNAHTSLFGGNIVVSTNYGGPGQAKAICGIEIDILNNSPTNNQNAELPLSLGLSLQSLGNYSGSRAIYMNNKWIVGVDNNATGIGFRYNNTTNPNGYGYFSAQTQGYPFIFIPFGSSSADGAAFSVNATGVIYTKSSIEIGNLNTANLPFIDFHSSGNNVDFDSRIISAGGTSATGNGTLQLIAANINLVGKGQVSGNTIIHSGNIGSGLSWDGTTLTSTGSGSSSGGNFGTTAGTYAQGNDSRIVNALNAATATATYATINSPNLTGVPTTTTAATNSNSSQIANTTFVNNRLINISTSNVQISSGSTLRSLASKLNDIINVKDFGATGNGSSDDTVSIQAAINSMTGGGTLYFPSGRYIISAALTFSSSLNGITIQGGNQYSCIIQQNTTNAAIFNVNGNFNSFYDFCLQYNGTPLAGGTAIRSAGSNNRFSKFCIFSAYIGMEFTTGSAQMADNFQIFNYENCGIYAHSINDVYISKFILNAGNATRGTLGGIRLTQQVEAFVATDGDILLGVYSLTTDATTYTTNNVPAYNKFNQVYFDSSTLSCVSLVGSRVFDFTSCWFSGARANGGVNAGVIISNCDSINFVSCNFFNCGGTGCVVTGTSARTTLSNCEFESNSVTAGSGASHGIIFDTNISDFTVMGSRFHNGLYSGQQGYGIVISSGCNRYNIIGNLLNGLVSGGILDNANASNSYKAGNLI